MIATRVIVELVRFGVHVTMSQDIEKYFKMLHERGNKIKHSKLVLELLSMGVVPESLSLCFEALDVRCAGADD